jgi:hypothetical protein
MSDGRGHNKVPVAVRTAASADATVEHEMLFRVHNIKWKQTTTVTPTELYIPVWDKDYDTAEQRANEYMAMTNAMEWAGDRAYFDLLIEEPYGNAGILGHSSIVLGECVLRMQELLLQIDATDEKNKYLIGMTNYQIKATAELLKKVQSQRAILGSQTSR